MWNWIFKQQKVFCFSYPINLLFLNFFFFKAFPFEGLFLRYSRIWWKWQMASMEILHEVLLGIYRSSQAQPNISINIARRSQQVNSAEPQRKFPLQNFSKHSLCPAPYVHWLRSMAQGQGKGGAAPLNRCHFAAETRSRTSTCIFLLTCSRACSVGGAGSSVGGSVLSSSALFPREETLTQLPLSAVHSNEWPL